MRGVFESGLFGDIALLSGKTEARVLGLFQVEFDRIMNRALETVAIYQKKAG